MISDSRTYNPYPCSYLAPQLARVYYNGGTIGRLLLHINPLSRLAAMCMNAHEISYWCRKFQSSPKLGRTLAHNPPHYPT